MITPRIPYTVISLPGLITMVERALTIVNQHHAENVFFTAPLQRLTEAKTFAVKAIGSSKLLQTTKTVLQADQDRDNSFDSLKGHVKAGMKRNNAAYRAACERLFVFFNKNKLNLSRLPYDQETAALISLFGDLETPQAVADLATIHATEWLQELKADQKSFEDSILVRGVERVDSAVPTDDAARKALVPALKGFYKLMDVAEENEMVADVTPTITLLNVMITEVVNAYHTN